MNKKLKLAISKLGKKKVKGSSVTEGLLYHDIPGIEANAHRYHTSDRIVYIRNIVDIRGKKILDLGCSVGGISMGLAKFGAKEVVGVDYDKDAVEVASLASEELGIKNVKFVYDKVDLDWIKKMERVDVCVWLSNWMWLVKEYGLETGKEMLFEMSEKADVLVFESSSDDGMAPIKGSTQKDIYSWLILNTGYQKVEDYGEWDASWHSRHLFVCSEPKFKWDRFSNVVERVDRKTIVRRNKKTGEEIKMKYLGIPTPKLTDDDITEILEDLKKRKIIHRDIIPSNLLFDGKKVHLIDYDWALVDGKGIKEEDLPPTVGEKFKSPNGFDDEYSLKVVQRHLRDKGIRVLKKSLLKIVTVHTQRDACTYYRIRQPLQAMVNQGLANVAYVDVNKITDNDEAMRTFGSADILVFRPSGFQIQKKLRELGMKAKFVFDADDNSFVIPPQSKFYRDFGTKEFYSEKSKRWVWRDGYDGFSIQRNINTLQQLIWQAKDADLHTVSTELMKNVFSAKEYYVAYNAINFDNYIMPPIMKGDEVRIGWQGSPSHFRDLQGVVTALEELMNKHKNVKLIIEGQFYKNLFKGIDRNRIEVYPWIETSGFSWRAICLNLDIALAPLANEEFNYFKSSIKFYHAGAMKVPTITSNIPPHSIDITDGINGVLYNSYEEFKNKLEFLIVNKDVRRKIGQNAYDWVKKNRDINDISRKLLDKYKSL